MLRRCPTCQQRIDDDRLLICPKCRTSLSAPAQAPALSQDQIDRVVIAVTDSLSKSGPTLDKLANPVAWRIVKSVHWWIAFPLFWIAVLVGSHFTIKGALEKLMISRIDQEFREPRIQKTVQEVVKTNASEMLTNEIQPEVFRFKDEVTTQVQNFQVFLDSLKADFQRDYQALSKEILQLKTRNHLAILADKSIAEGDRAAFNELEGLSKNEQEFALKIAAHAELRRVISFWSLMSTTEHASISVTLKDGTLKEDKEIPTPNLIAALFHNRDWRARAVAARLLNNRPENGVPDHLLSCARNDTHLEVVKHVLQSFKSITGSDVKGVFNVDGLERWWKEHSAEVSERLTEMK